MSGELSERTNGLGLEGRLPDLDLMRFSMRSSISWPASGAAVTTVSGDAPGEGTGLEVLNRG